MSRTFMSRCRVTDDIRQILPCTIILMLNLKNENFEISLSLTAKHEDSFFPSKKNKTLQILKWQMIEEALSEEMRLSVLINQLIQKFHFGNSCFLKVFLG